MSDEKKDETTLESMLETSVRDQFALQAVQPVLSMLLMRGGMSMEVDMNGGMPLGMKAEAKHLNYEEVAFECYEVAEALMKEREKRRKK